jgi:tetratricopeptide (TPR) repeat protein
MLEVGQFGLEERRPASLLVASISERANRSIDLSKALQLPAFRLSLPTLASPRLSGNASTLNLTSAVHRVKHIHGRNLHKAGEEVQRLVALVGGVLVAGITKTAHHLSHAHDKQRNSLPFHQSFGFPWSHRGRITESNRESKELARNLVQRGHEYERALDIRAALQCFEEAAKLVPDDIESLCMAAKQWSDLTFYHDVRSDQERQLVNLKAVEYAERATAAHPTRFEGYLGLCISKGRLALFCDNRNKVHLAKEAQDNARKALELGPESDIAHHLMGRWHHEMAKINGLVRTLIRIMYGTALQTGTREDAMLMYRKAIELAPQRLVHHTELARVALELGHTEEARAALLTALKCEVEDINAWHTRIDAEMLMAQIERRPWRQPSLVPPGVKTLKTASLSTAALLGVEEAALQEHLRSKYTEESTASSEIASKKT